MALRPETVANLGTVEDALSRALPVDAVLDLADEAIEHAEASGDADALRRLAALLDGAAQGRSDGRGLLLAARRARAIAATLPAPAETGAPTVAVPVLASAEDVAAPPDVAPAKALAAVVYAGWWRRVFAHVVDWVVIGSAMAIVPGESELALLVIVALPVGYFAAMHAYVHGQTIGKAVFGIAVRMEPGEIDLPRAIGRALVQWTLWVTVIGGIVDSLVPLGDDRHRSLHDRVVGTVVVRVR